jgi:hypothetical protein
MTRRRIASDGTPEEARIYQVPVEGPLKLAPGPK